MTTTQETIPLIDSGTVGVTRAMESLWLLTAFFVPLVFFSPAIMDNGFDIPKVTLFRSLVGLMAVLWLVEWGLTGREINSHHLRLDLEPRKKLVIDPPHTMGISSRMRNVSQ